MNQKWEDKRIRQLFDELREEDEVGAPRFEATMGAALSKRVEAAASRLVWRFAIAAALLIAVAASVFLLRGGSPVEPRETVTAEPGVKPHETPAPSVAAPILAEKSVTRVKPKPPKPKLTRRRLIPPEGALISQWRSPTEFLLRTPADELMKFVPRLGSSAVDIKIEFVDRKN